MSFPKQFSIMFSKRLLATHLDFTREVVTFISLLDWGQNVVSVLSYFFIKRIFLLQSLIKSTLSLPSALILTLK